MAETIQLLTSIAALVLGVGYVFGGLIVNLHLASYGITEYQVLRIKYLVVGLIYFANGGAVLMVAVLISGAALVISADSRMLIVLFALSLGAAVAFIALWNLKQRTWHPLVSWTIFTLVGALGYAYPLTATFYQAVSPNALTLPYLAAGLMIFALVLMAQLYFYARHIYGSVSSLDPIGMGIPVRVRLAGKSDDLQVLAYMGIPIAAEMTDTVSLIDETDDQYILSTGNGAAMQVFKVDKSLIKGIVYLSR